jgi:hypothetical protein
MSTSLPEFHILGNLQNAMQVQLLREQLCGSVAGLDINRAMACRPFPAVD